MYRRPCYSGRDKCPSRGFLDAALVRWARTARTVYWNRLRRPVLETVDGPDSRGVEDPWVTEIDGVFYMCYTAYGREFHRRGRPTHSGGGITPMIARSHNLITWEVLGPLVRGEDNKDHVLFPRRIGDRYVALHRRRPHVWLADSHDLRAWPDADYVYYGGDHVIGLATCKLRDLVDFVPNAE